MGHAWLALSQTVMTVSIFSFKNSVNGLERCQEMSIPISFMTWMAMGWTKPAGFDTALWTLIRPRAAFRRMPSAMWLRQELPVQRIRTVGLAMLTRVSFPSEHHSGGKASPRSPPNRDQGAF